MTKSFFAKNVTGALSKHVGKGLCARPFDKLRVTALFRMDINLGRTEVSIRRPYRAKKLGE
jgi:hypothetical protein